MEGGTLKGARLGLGALPEGAQVFLEGV